MPAPALAVALAAAPADLGGALLRCPEDQWFDRKSARVTARALADALIAFANAEGGTIVVGLHDGRVEGTDSLAGRRNALVQAKMDFAVPPVRARERLVECLNAAGRPDHLLVIEIEPAIDVVHANVKDEVLLRVGDEARRLGFAQRQELELDRGQGSFEARSVPGVALADLDAEAVSSYADALGASDAHTMLVGRGLAGPDGPTVAGVLLFGSTPGRWFPEAHLRVLRYRGTRRGAGADQQLTADVRVEGALPGILREARQAVSRLQPTRRALARAGVFEDVGLIPQDAWIEGIVNAVVHRSYSIAGDHIRVEIFDDRIEITSPGRFPGIVDLSDPTGILRYSRNPRIARVSSDLRFGQELGEGIRRMFAEMRTAGLGDPVYRQGSSAVRLTLSAEPVHRALDARLVPDARRVTAALREAGRLGTGELADQIGRSRPVALRVLRSLEADGLIRRVGTSVNDPRAYWELVVGG